MTTKAKYMRRASNTRASGATVERRPQGRNSMACQIHRTCGPDFLFPPSLLPFRTSVPPQSFSSLSTEAQMGGWCSMSQTTSPVPRTALPPAHPLAHVSHPSSLSTPTHTAPSACSTLHLSLPSSSSIHRWNAGLARLPYYLTRPPGATLE